MDKAPPPSYQASAPRPATFTVVSALNLGPYPTTITCPSCHEQVNTSVVVENSNRTHLIALILCLLCFPCVCVPYCNDSCRAKNHYCPSCRAYVGTYDH